MEKPGKACTGISLEIKSTGRKAGDGATSNNLQCKDSLACKMIKRLLQTDIISKEYLEGCYKLGQQYPDLCSSVFLMCEKGDTK